MRLRENSRSASAAATALPRIKAATRLSFCGLTRILRATAFASLSARPRSRAFLLIAESSASSRTFRLAVRRMAIERPRRRKLAELVTDHLLGHQHRDVLLPVVDPEGEPDELRQDGRAPAPDFDHLVPTRGACLLGLLEQVAVD